MSVIGMSRRTARSGTRTVWLGCCLAAGGAVAVTCAIPAGNGESSIATARTVRIREFILAPKGGEPLGGQRPRRYGRERKVVEYRPGTYHWSRKALTETAMDFNLDEGIPILERTPSVISRLLDDLPEDWTRVTEGPDTWSPHQVVAHLINGERTDWIPRARIILKQGKYRRFDPFDRFFDLGTQRPLNDLLEEFDKLRSENVATLRGWNLKELDLELTGEHPEFGRVTMRQLLATWVVHDLSHIAQITRTMARAYTEAVGPWTAYFRVLQRDVRQ